MCGIFGQVNKNTSIDKDLLVRTTNKLLSRGPDSLGTYIHKNVGLGFRRLAIVDLSENGNQPMKDSSGSSVIVFNGEIYNHLDLKKNLLGKYKWKGSSDTEVIINSYKEKGIDAIKDLEGMFGLCIYDKKVNKLILARDHFGKKPLYYYKDENTFVFASEIKSILNIPYIKAKLTVDTLSLNKFMFYGYIPSPHSIFKQIKKVKPATLIEFDINTWEITNDYTFWSLENITVNSNTKTEDEILTDIDILLESAVRKRLMSDVPFGMFLSGGLDSTLLSYYLGKLAPKTKTYTVSYPDIPKIDESIYAKETAKKFNLVNRSCIFDSSFVKKNFLEMMDYLDEPLADAAIIPLYFISKESKKDFTVVLSGDGGDEVFGGYTKYKVQKYIEKLSFFGFIPGFILNFFPHGGVYNKLLSSFSLPLEQRQFIFGSGSLLKNEVISILRKSYSLDTVFKEAFTYAHKYSKYNTDVINKSLYLDCKIQLPDWYLVKGDRATMSNSQEMRNPFLDKNLVEYLFSLKGKLKIKNGVTKYLEKKLLERHFDKEFIHRPKRGFGVPLDNWIRNELKDVFDAYLYKGDKYFNNDVVKKLHQEHLNGVKDNQFKLLRVFAFNYFMEKWL